MIAGRGRLFDKLVILAACEAAGAARGKHGPALPYHLPMGFPDRERGELDSLDAIEPMGPHLEDRNRIDRAQVDIIAGRIEGILGNEAGIAGTYHKGVEKGEHRWALYELYQARIGTDAVGRRLVGDGRLDVLNRGLGKLQPVFNAMDKERRAELASQAAEVKRDIGRELGEETLEDPASSEGAEAVVESAGVNPAQLVASLSDIISRGKAATAAVTPGVSLIETELGIGDVALGKVSVPTADGTTEFDFGGVRSLDNAVRAVDLLEGFIKLRELSGKEVGEMDGAGQAAHTIEFLKVSGQIAKGVIDLGAMTARGIARLRGADDIVKHLDGFLAIGQGVGKVLSAADALSGVFVLLSDTSSDMERADAVKNIAVFSIEALEMGATAAGAGAEGTALAGTALGSTASMLAHWGGPVATSIALTWEMLKWIGAETHEFHVTFSAFMMNHAFRTLSHHAQEIGRHGSRLAALARRMEQESDPDVRDGIMETWVEETKSLAAEVKAIVTATTPKNDYTTPGAYWTIQDRFATIRANYAGVGSGAEAVSASIECLVAIKDVLGNADDYVERERQRDPDRTQTDDDESA